MIVTLLTDFGVVDHYVGVMKGVILGADPAIRIVDLSHGVPAGDVQSGAFVLLASYPYFPAGTVHLVVVDPGVGTDRRPIVVSAAGQLFVGPDNGVLSYVLEKEPTARVTWIRDNRFVRTPLSTTFHGRDLFAPVAAALAGGTLPETLGSEVEDALRLPSLQPRQGDDGSLQGRILHVDRFGNCVTSYRRDDVAGLSDKALRVASQSVPLARTREDYARAPEGEPFPIWGSSGFLEISLNGSSASTALGVGVGDGVVIR